MGDSGAGAVVAALLGRAGRGRLRFRPGERAVEFAPALAVADSVLFEGYLLYPYRRSSGKNRVRWQFGVLAPRAWIEAHAPEDHDSVAGSSESWWNRTECLLEAGSEATVEVVLRFLQSEPQGTGLPTTADPGREAGRLEAAVPREVHLAFPVAEAAGDGLTVCFEVPAIGRRPERGRADAGSGEPAVLGTLHVRTERIPARSPLQKLSLRVENTTTAAGDLSRPEALCRSLISTHLLLGVVEGAFLSLLDPPEWASGTLEAACHNVRTFPVLAGPPGSSRLMLSSPIILYDHPRVAPESPGDLFDATEIDEILSLRALTLTEQEKAEARATDPRAAEIVDRVEAMPTEVLARLHGAVRSLRRVPSPPRATPDDAPAVASGDGVDGSRGAGSGAEAIVIGGVSVGDGSRIRLHPRRQGTDVQDMFLDGRTGTVAGLLTDVDGSRFLAVTVDDDPRSALGAGPGRLRHFSPDEVEPLDRAPGATP